MTTLVNQHLKIVKTEHVSNIRVYADAESHGTILSVWPEGALDQQVVVRLMPGDVRSLVALLNAAVPPVSAHP